MNENNFIANISGSTILIQLRFKITQKNLKKQFSCILERSFEAIIDIFKCFLTWSRTTSLIQWTISWYYNYYYLVGFRYSTNWQRAPKLQKYALLLLLLSKVNIISFVITCNALGQSPRDDHTSGELSKNISISILSKYHYDLSLLKQFFYIKKKLNARKDT